ncbi:hypothetical protein AB0H92_22095 [Streptomyces phaeochromogenes]|uniref:hypothetical protein n=1 Tax=Streptomyces phaeochromogenes TaxID=1923 RepID=UPI0033E85206
MPLPPWLPSHLPGDPRFRTFVAFTDEVARLLELQPALPTEAYERRYDTDRLWTVWRFKDGGASLFLERPYADLQEGVTVSVQWHQSPNPEVVAAMIRAYVRRGRREQRRPCWPVRRYPCGGEQPSQPTKEQRVSAYVEIPRPYESAPGRFTVDLAFPAASKRRAKEHHDVAWTLADVHGVEASTPFKLNPRWSLYKEISGTDEKYGGLDDRRLTVQGGARELSRYLVALVRVLDEVEALATRAVRVFGVWKRSVAAEPFLEYEDASTMRVRSREFRADVLRVLVEGLDVRRAVGELDSSRALWEQQGAVAEEVQTAVGGVDLERADEDSVAVQEARMVPAAVAEAERLVVAEAARVEAERLEEERVELFRGAAERVSRAQDKAEAERVARDGQMGLFPEVEARKPFTVPEPIVKRPRRAPRSRVRVAVQFPGITWQVARVSPAAGPEVKPERQRYAPAAWQLPGPQSPEVPQIISRG